MMIEQQEEGAEVHLDAFEAEEEEGTDNNSTRSLLNALSVTNWGIFSMSAQNG